MTLFISSLTKGGDKKTMGGNNSPEGKKSKKEGGGTLIRKPYRARASKTCGSKAMFKGGFGARTIDKEK